MRLKLVIIASLLAAFVGAGATIAVVLALFSSLRAISSPDLVVAATFLLPAATCLMASIFVYRHTARRRKLQALLTALLSIILSLAALVIASIVTARRDRLEPPPLQERQVTRAMKL
jgi:hypothetical protein